MDAVIMKDITAGEVIKTIRKEKGITQSELSTMCGIPEKLLSLYERGAVEVPYTRLEQILNSMGIEVILSNGKVGEPC